MFETLSHTALQQYWWILVSLLGAILVFLLFVQGGQSLIYQLGKTDVSRKLILNTVGSKWEFTFTTLVTFGGAFFASFPLFYSTSFSGAYWVWFLILIAFVVQAVAYEFRSKPENLLGTRTFDAFLFVNGLLGTVLLGAAVSTFFTGSHFTVDAERHSQWTMATRGLEAAFNIQNLSLGLTVFFLSRVLAILYFFNAIDNEEVIRASRKQLLYNAIPFVFFFLLFATLLLLSNGFAVNPATQEVFMQPYKYAVNLLEMPLVAVLFLSGVVLVLAGIAMPILKFEKFGGKAIWYSGIGTVLTVFALLLLAGFNNTAFYPSVADLQSSLTIANSSSSHYTLTAMSYVSLFIPFVLLYIVYVWRVINKKKVDVSDLEKEHVY
ncbi:MAG TPA: cytochrome d ubiquinol oxidase subunit II [Bacteroidales bacterium]|nr:cytochrome d ubiquinol oxidase subunit II [Bacteroidales bacterium]